MEAEIKNKNRKRLVTPKNFRKIQVNKTKFSPKFKPKSKLKLNPSHKNKRLHQEDLHPNNNKNNSKVKSDTFITKSNYLLET